jgi:hypothetical protein
MHDARFWQCVQRCRHRGMTCKRCCWLWQGTRTKRGYGAYYLASTGSIFAYRYALELSHGAMLLQPLRTVVMHLCDNPPCVNPSHLCVETYGDNFRDAVRKGIMLPHSNRKVA